MKFSITTLSILLLFISCTTNKQLSNTEYREGIPIVEFCDLPEHLNELVYIEGIYSGYEEYWSLTGNADCNPELNGELAFKNYGNNIPRKYQSEFRKVRNNYTTSHLNLKLIGRFDNEGRAYGHLGSNNCIFIVEEVIELKVVKVTKF